MSDLYASIRDENDIMLMRLKELAISVASDPNFNFPNWIGFSESTNEHRDFLIAELARTNPLLNEYNYFGCLIFCSMLCCEIEKR